MWVIVGAILGARVLMIVRSLPEYIAAPKELLSPALLVAAGDFYGGFIGALIMAAIFFRRNPQLPFWPAADVCAPAIALGQAIGRIGCLMAGDDYGRATTMPWGIAFTDPDAATIGGAPLGVPLHPVQLYESIFCLILFVLLVRLSRRKRFDGEVILAYTFLYAVGRFILEFYPGRCRSRLHLRRAALDLPIHRGDPGPGRNHPLGAQASNDKPGPPKGGPHAYP